MIKISRTGALHTHEEGTREQDVNAKQARRVRTDNSDDLIVLS
jgi:hypothetical protein